MMDLNGHEAGNGGHRQGKSKVQRASSTRQIVTIGEAELLVAGEGSIRQRPVVARSGRPAGVLSPGHAPQGCPKNRRELPISSHTRRTASGNGSGGTCNQGSTGGSMDGSGSSLTTP